MEGRGRGRGRGDGGGRGRGDGGGRGRGDGGGRGRGEGGGRGRGDSGGRGRGDRGGGGWSHQQQRDEVTRGSQHPGPRGDGGASHYDRGDQGQRQRDGDWTCSSCRANNFARNQQCFKCHTDKSGAGASSSGDGSRQREGDWTCSNCRFNNFAKNQQCYKCHTDKSGGSGGGEGQQGSWGGRQGDGQRGRGRDDGGYQRGGRGGGRGRGDWGGGGGRGRGGGGGGRGGDRGTEIDWAAQEEMETASQTSSKSDPVAEETKRLALLALNDLPVALAGEDKNKYSVIPHRINKGPKVGTRGRPIKIEVNHVKLAFDPKKTLAIYYDCGFKPDKLSRKILRRIMNIMRDRHYPRRSPAFDGKKNLYSCGEIPLFKEAQLNDTVELPPEEGSSKPLKVEVTIKEVVGESRIDLSQITKYMRREVMEYPQKAIQVMEIVLRNAPATAGFTQVGRSFFKPPPSPITLGNGLELYHGFFQSVVLGWETLLNVDVAHKGFPEAREVIDLMCEFKMTGRNPKPYPSDLRFNPNELENFKKFIKGLRVAYAIPGIPTSRRKHTVVGVKPPANKFTFVFKKDDNDAGREMTIEQYFKQEKRYTIKYPNLPCLHVGDIKRNVCLPPELCSTIVGQIMMKKLDQDQTRAMIKEAAKPPEDRKRKIMDALMAADHNRDDCVKEFGINVGQQFSQVPARILTPPTIEYGNKTAQPENGEWKVQPFKQATSMDKWAIASASSQFGTNDLRQIVDRLRQVSKDVGMTISEPYRTDSLIQDRFMSDDDISRTLFQAFRKYKEDGVQIAVMLIPEKTYSKVKKVAEIDVGLVTQCILEKTMRKGIDPSTGKNILLKINSKLNGVNHTVIRNVQDRLKGPDRVIDLLKGTMLMGADVTHPSPDQKDIPSVAAVTASHDPLQFQYNMVWRLQPPRQEIIGDLHNIVIKQLQFYKAKNGKAPDRIIFYRDGVSEGQFIQVLQVEMTCIKWACRKVLGKDLPVTFLVVQKRHHTRFFPTARDHTDRKGNVPPGTVVDTNITHPVETDFYMVSHASLQGTSRPTKYHKLWDDNRINEDDLEELTFFLCHMFSRCTRSVSYPAPTYYAHLGAARGRVYLEGAKVNIEQLAQEMERRTIQVNITNNSPMFFT